MQKKKIWSLFLGLVIFITSGNITFANGTVYLTDDMRLEKKGREVYVSGLDPLIDGGYTWRTIYKINNVSKVLSPIDYKLHFDKGAGFSGTDEFPYIEVDGPLDIESLRDDIYFDTYLYEREGRNFKGTDTSFYMDGKARYLVYDNNKQDEVLVNTGDLKNQKAKWDKEKKKYLHAGYEKGGRIYSEDGRLEYKGNEKEYSHFLLRGENWRDQKELPRVFIKFARDKEVGKVNAKFKDVNKKSWYFNYVTKLVEIGGVKGFEDGTFKPNDKITVGEFLKMAVSSVTGEEYETTDKVHWATGVYDYAVEEGIIKRGDFSRNKNALNADIKREDMAYIISNIDRVLKNNSDNDIDDIKKDIRDYKDISKNRQDGVLQAYSKDLIKGRDKGFDPKGLTTRAEATTVIVRLLDR